MRIGKVIVFSALVVAAAISVSCKSFGDPVIKIRGVVRDSRGNPLESATTRLEREKDGEIRKVDLDQITKSDGSFEFSVVGALPENTRVSVKKEGFKTFGKRLEQAGKQDLNIILESEVK